MLNRNVRHLVVAVALVAVVGVTAASAAGSVNALQAVRIAAPTAAHEMLPQVSGDLGEVVVHAPGYLGEIVVHAPGDLGEVLVSVARLPGVGQLMAEVVVMAPRFGGADFAPATDTAMAPAMLAVAR